MKSSVLSHLRSLFAEATAVGLACFSMYSVLAAAAVALGIMNATFNGFVLPFLYQYACIVLIWKSGAARLIPHRSYPFAAYLLLAQALAGLHAASIIVLLGECLGCPGSLHDIFLYALAVGTPLGMLSAFFSKLFSVDVDSPKQAV